MTRDDSSADESQPLTEDSSAPRRSDVSSDARESTSSASTTSLLFERLSGNRTLHKNEFDSYKDTDDLHKESFQELDIEDAALYRNQGVDRKYKRWLYIIGGLCVVGWGLALVFFLFNGTYKHRSTLAHNPDAMGEVGAGAGQKVTIDELQKGMWYARSQGISWIGGPSGEDGLLLERGGSPEKGYLVVDDVRSKSEDEGKEAVKDSIILMKQHGFESNGEWIYPDQVWPSSDLKTVLIMSDRQHNWRHSFTGRYWLFDVASQTGQALDPSDPHSRMQLATWSPTSDAVVFTRNNDMFLRKIEAGVKPPLIMRLTADGGEEMFNGVPDWVYEEEVFSGNSATWWSEDGKFIAFLATNETGVPDYPVQYFISRPSLTKAEPGLESYPEVRQIRYPKAGAPNPVVHLRFYDVEANAVFTVPIEDDFGDLDRLITEVVWAGQHGQVLIRQTNRESDFLKMVLIDVKQRKGKIVRSQDVKALDGGWFEVSETTTFVPSDPSNGRAEDGYIDTIIHEGYDHLAYFTPLDNPEPKLLTSGKWEVVDAPSAVDLKNNFVYFVATKDGSTQRHVYKVNIDGTNLEPVSDTTKDGYYAVSFSKGAGYALLSYQGPNIPWQKVISTPSNPTTYEHLVEDNKELAQRASEHELPVKVYQTVTIDGFELNVVERRPLHFDSSKKYPVLFYLYGGPGSQTVDKKFSVDFQSYVASNLEYIVVTVDGRGTGLIGREARTIIRGNLGYWEARDQIATAKMWAAKSYVDETRMAIWGWSYGGYMTLKTLEQDAGQTFRYGMAVAPVTDWRFYDSIYTERWMHTPQHNPTGYTNASISNVAALGANTRFLLMHGVADDNVHMQNSLILLDKLDLAGVENYDVHVFPDSDHSIYFHNANRVVYDKLSWWLVNAMNGEWARIERVVPLRAGVAVGAE